MKYKLRLKKLPFELDPKQVIYVEGNYDLEVNNFIVHNYSHICDYFKSKGYEFCYLPLLSTSFNVEIRRYYNPLNDNNRNIPIKSSLLLEYLAIEQNRKDISPSLVYYYNDITSTILGSNPLRCITLDNINEQDSNLAGVLSEIISDQTESSRNYSSSYSIDRSDESYSIHRYKTDDFVEELPKRRNPYICQSIDPITLLELGFDDETTKLIAEVATKVDALKQKGISKFVLEKILYGEPKPSRLVITHDYRILLPDYNNMEIVMTPLVKAVYILFLSHPEGIPFKSLADYRKELLGVYLTIKGDSEPTEEILNSISAITDPFNNSINEKCARIREAFVSQFDEEIAKHYFVTGKRGEPKAITLSRDLVEWE